MASLEETTAKMESLSAGDGPDDAAAAEAAALAAAKKRDKKKRNKANKKKASGEGGEAADGDGDEGDAAPPEPAGQLTKERLFELEKARRSASAKGEAQSHAFWDTQPVPKMGEAVNELGPLVKQTKDEIRQEPYTMGAGMEWSVVDINDADQCAEVYTLLTENYVEDDDAMFRFDYSVAFLLWALTPPGFLQELHLGVRSTKSKRLMAFISGVPASMKVHGSKVEMVEINFLCVHKKLRSKRLAPVLIKEITRRVNTHGIFQAVYTAGVVLPSPVAECRYWHRSLNPKKLVDIGFSRISERMNMARTVKLYKLPELPACRGIQPLTPEHCPSACKLLNTYLATFKLAPTMRLDEFSHQLLPRTGVVDSFVIVDEASGAVTDLCSFYHLPSSVMKHPKHSKLHAAYSFYNVATSVPLKELLNDLLILAKKADMDVFNALDLMANGGVLKDLKFGIGDGHLQYYLYNYKCPALEPSDVGLVLL